MHPGPDLYTFNSRIGEVSFTEKALRRLDSYLTKVSYRSLLKLAPSDVLSIRLASTARIRQWLEESFSKPRVYARRRSLAC